MGRRSHGASAVASHDAELINGLPLTASDREFAEIEVNGQTEMVMTASGVIKWLLLADVADFKEERRRRQVERLQERARAAWAAESIRANPRPLDEVIAATFDVQAIDDGMRAQIGGQRNAAMQALECLLDSSEVVS